MVLVFASWSNWTIRDNTDPEVVERHIERLVSFTVHGHLKHEDIV